MKAYKTAATISEDGEIRLTELLPFQPGEQVEVIVLPLESASTRANPYPLRGLPIRYEDPTEPVAESDWDALH
jgi:hypothetical protein